MYSDKPNIANSPQFELYATYSMKVISARLNPDLEAQPMKSEAGSGVLSVLDTPHKVLDSSVPRLFLFLPSHLTLWNDSDPTTHSFRLYFLCDCEYESAAEGIPTHVHLNDHPGYDLDQPLEFIRQFGRFSLTILEAVKTGFMGEKSCIPKLDTFQILESLEEDDLARQQLTPTIIGPLVDKAIAYIQKQQLQEPQQQPQNNHCISSILNAIATCFPRKRNQEPQLVVPSFSSSNHNNRSILSYLRPQNGDSGVGGLSRFLSYSDGRWLCESHMFEASDTEELEEYVESQEGTIDLQLATIAIDLSSLLQVNTLATTLDQGVHVFDLSLNFTWSPSRQGLRTALQHLSRCYASDLQINGTTLNLRQSPLEYGRDPFAHHLAVHTIGDSSGQLITLSSHPQPSESYLYFGEQTKVFGFVFEGMVNRRSVNWTELGSNLDDLDRYLENDVATDTQRLDAMLIELSRIITPFFAMGLKGVDLFDSSTVQCRLGVTNGAMTGITELHLPFQLLDLRTEELPILQKVIVQPDVENILGLGPLYAVMAKSPMLQFVDIPTQESQVFAMIGVLFNTWPSSSRTVHVTLFEHDSGNGGASLIKLQIGPQRRGNKDSPVAIDILEWHYDHVSEELVGWAAHVLDLATQCPLTHLTSLRLKTSLLSEDGLEIMERVLKQSDLQVLYLECGAFDPSLASHLGRFLDAVNWSAIKSLEVSGDNIDGWMDLWAKHSNISRLAPFEAQLFRLSINSSGGQEQRLSHSSALWLHRVIYLLSPTEVRLNNVVMQEAGDRDLIRDLL